MTKEMTCKFLTINKKKPCDYYLKTGLCEKPDMFRCVEYIEKFEPILSNSGIKSFIECPRKYYLGSIKGIKVKEELKSDAVKIGSMVDSWVTQPGALANKFICPSDVINLAYEKATAICKAFDKMIKPLPASIQGQKEFAIKQDGHPTITGKIDLAGSNFFMELKCTTRPEFYINKYWIHDQMGTYFLANSKYEYGILLCIVVPKLKQTGSFKDETLEEYRDRCYRDMCNRPVEYFKGYKKEKRTFGVKFYRTEFDLDALQVRYKVIGKQVQESLKAKWVGDKINDCICEGYWYQNRSNCISPFVCDYLQVCDTGGVSKDIYEYRKG